MSENNVKEAKKTPISTVEFVESARRIIPNVFGSEFPNEAIALFWAQWALETGKGKHCYNYNLGNIKQFDRSKPLHMLDHVWEIINGEKKIFPKGHPQTWFRAYENLDEGMYDYLSLLKYRYKSSIEGAKEGDPVKFVSMLKKYGYFTANEQEYLKAIKSLQSEFLRTLKG
jgi:flagellum-specific peptidoglycan hydrolase FlgJ